MPLIDIAPLINVAPQLLGLASCSQTGGALTLAARGFAVWIAGGAGGDD